MLFNSFTIGLLIDSESWFSLYYMLIDSESWFYLYYSLNKPNRAYNYLCRSLCRCGSVYQPMNVVPMRCPNARWLCRLRRDDPR